MEFLLYKEPALLGIVLVLVVQIIAIGIRVVSGGFRAGHLEKRIQFNLDQTLLSAFSEKFHLRMAELRFDSGNGAGQFFQGGPGEFGAFMHAKTRKMLSAQIVESGTGQVAVTLTLRYLDPIVADTGESSYRDAVLNYVSGQADQMITVPNPSLMALNGLIGGGLALILALLAVMSRAPQWGQAIVVLAGTGVLVGGIALVSILRKPGEITGKGSAVIGIILSAVAVGLVLIGGVMARVASTQ